MVLLHVKKLTKILSYRRRHKQHLFSTRIFAITTMPAITRSMTTKLLEKDVTMAPFKLEALITPGVSSAIAKHLSDDEEALKSMFLLINDSRYRHELMIHCEPLKKAHDDRLLEMEQREEALREEKMRLQELEIYKKSMMMSIQHYMDICNLTEGYEYNKLAIFALYEHMCDMVSDMHLLGVNYGMVVHQKLYDLEMELAEDDVEAIDKLYEFEYRLSTYFEWAQQNSYDCQDEYEPLYDSQGEW